MHLKAHVLSFLALFATSGVLAQQSASPTSGSPDVAYPAGEAIIFCSGQDCTGTCEVVNSDYLLGTQDDGEYAPNDMGFQSIYWYDPDSSPWVVYTCIDYYHCGAPVNIGPNTCYNLDDNGIPTDFYYYWYVVESDY